MRRCTEKELNEIGESIFPLPGYIQTHLRIIWYFVLDLYDETTQYGDYVWKLAAPVSRLLGTAQFLQDEWRLKQILSTCSFPLFLLFFRISD